MRNGLLPCALALLAGACSPQDVRIRGTLADGWTDDPLFVSLAGEGEPTAIQNDSFARSGVSAGVADLRIGTDDDELARMAIGELPAGASLSLERIRRDRGRDLAFPSVVRLEGADIVTINGIRVGDADALPGRVDEAGVILAMGDDALVVRPRNAALPDLAVVVSPETRVTDLAGTDASLDDASAGDSVRVEGATRTGYLYARQVVLRQAASGQASSAPARDAPAADAGTSRRERSSGRARSDGEGGEKDRKDEKRERRGGERDDRRIPRGQRPPPGECRDWDPDLPAGQQPPPRKC